MSNISTLASETMPLTQEELEKQASTNIHVLLKLPFFAEPDKQRFTQFVMKCLEMFHISLFVGAAKLPKMLNNFCISNQSKGNYSNLQLMIINNKLYLGIFKRGTDTNLTVSREGFFVSLPEVPSAEKIERITENLRLQSEVSDPELLKQHNESINQEMQIAKQRAAEELLQLEKKLDAKRLQLQESIRAAEIDSLTQIFNRGAYDRRLEESISHCNRQGETLSLIMLDLDYFKQVNDTLGHQAGDEVLKNMAKFMTRFTRKDVDYVCRMGGDEFVIIFFADPVIASRAAENILQSMDGKVSIGISQLREDDTVGSLVARTDEALYEAKENGRGQVVIGRQLEHT